MCSIALTPRNGMLPCAIRPRVVDLEPVDAAMADADAIDVERLRDDDVVDAIGADAAAARASQATPANPPLSSSTVPLISTAPSSSTPARRIASAA